MYRDYQQGTPLNIELSEEEQALSQHTKMLRADFVAILKSSLVTQQETQDYIEGYDNANKQKYFEPYLLTPAQQEAVQTLLDVFDKETLSAPVHGYPPNDMPLSFTMRGERAMGRDKNHKPFVGYTENLMSLFDVQGNYVSSGVVIPALQKLDCFEYYDLACAAIALDNSLPEERISINLEPQNLQNEQYRTKLAALLEVAAQAGKYPVLEIVERPGYDENGAKEGYLNFIEQYEASVDDIGAPNGTHDYYRILEIAYKSSLAEPNTLHLKIDGELFLGNDAPEKPWHHEGALMQLGMTEGIEPTVEHFLAAKQTIDKVYLLSTLSEDSLDKNDKELFVRFSEVKKLIDKFKDAALIQQHMPELDVESVVERAQYPAHYLLAEHVAEITGFTGRVAAQSRNLEGADYIDEGTWVENINAYEAIANRRQLDVESVMTAPCLSTSRR